MTTAAPSAVATPSAATPRELSAADIRRVIFASSLGTVFEWYDFYLYGSLAAIIGEYAPHRVLTVVFDRPVAVARLAEFGEVVRAEPLQATLHVPRAEVSARAAALLTALPVADIAITDAEIDEVIRRIFGAAEARR